MAKVKPLILELRNEDLYKAYVRGLEQCHPASFMDAVELARTSPAPRFYIEPETATIIISRMKAGTPMNLHPIGMKRAEELFRRYNEYIRTAPRMSIEKIMEEIVRMPAPEFYIGPSRARKIIMEERHKAMEKIWRIW